MELILASASPRRKELMGLITPDYRVAVSDVDESALTAEHPALLAQTLGTAKARAVAAQYPNSVVIGCDTVVDLDGCVYGKPADVQQARAMMRALSGRTHCVHTGVCVCTRGGEQVFCETTRVTFLPLTDAEIEAYIHTDEPYDKAGGYGVQGQAAKFVCRIEGCFFNVMGLPVSQLYQVLKPILAQS